jgi:hypothetical protein
MLKFLLHAALPLPLYMAAGEVLCVGQKEGCICSAFMVISSELAEQIASLQAGVAAVVSWGVWELGREVCMLLLIT